VTPRLRREVVKFEKYREQFTFLRDNDITGQESLTAFIARTEETLATLTKQRTILNVRKKKRRSLYAALADVEALAPVKQFYEDGLPGMEREFAQYMEAASILERCNVSKEQLTEEKAELYERIAQINRSLRAERKKLALCREIQSGLPNMEREIQRIEEHGKEVNQNERRRR
jgi:uncharacterized protein YPO0396